MILLLTDRLLRLQAALSRGLLPDDETLKQLVLDPELPLAGRDISTLRWPEEPLRYVLTSERAHPDGHLTPHCHPSLAALSLFEVFLLACPFTCYPACCSNLSLNVPVGSLSTMGVSRFCKKYPAVLSTLQRSVLELVCKYQKTVLG